MNQQQILTVLVNKKKEFRLNVKKVKKEQLGNPREGVTDFMMSF